MVELREGSALLHLMRSAPDGSGAIDGRRSNGRPRSGGQGSRLEVRGSRSPLEQDAPAPRGAGTSSGADRSPRTAEPTVNEPPAASREPRSGERGEPSITCGFCGKEFVEDRTQATCQACPLSQGCGLMRCPHCGYENAKEPAWLVKLKEWIR